MVLMKTSYRYLSTSFFSDLFYFLFYFLRVTSPVTPPVSLIQNMVLNMIRFPGQLAKTCRFACFLQSKQPCNFYILRSEILRRLTIRQKWQNPSKMERVEREFFILQLLSPCTTQTIKYVMISWRHTRKLFYLFLTQYFCLATILYLRKEKNYQQD